MDPKTALLLGATGLVGGECLRRLISDDDYGRIIVLTRTPLPATISSPKIESHVISFDRIDNYRHLLKADYVFCALGSTIKKAGTKEQFYKVDFTYIHEIAKGYAQRGTGHFLLVSSMGANVHSWIFYSRVKGELEQALQKLPFASLSIFRPSLILGNRKEYRLKEEISKQAARIFAFVMPRKYQPIEAADIAKAMLKVARASPAGLRIYESDEIQNMAK